MSSWFIAMFDLKQWILLICALGRREEICPHTVLGETEPESSRLCHPSEGAYSLGGDDGETLVHCAGLPAPHTNMVRTSVLIAVHG